MNESHIIKSLNLTQGKIITMETAKSRLEYEAFPMIDGISLRGECLCKTGPAYDVCITKCLTDSPCIPVTKGY